MMDDRHPETLRLLIEKLVYKKIPSKFVITLGPSIMYTFYPHS